MAYQFVSAPSNQAAVMTALRDFAVTNGWTNEHFSASTPGFMTLSRGGCFVSFGWNGSETAASASIAMWQSLGYSAGQASTPWGHPDDSGNGTNTTNFGAGRRVSAIGTGPYVGLHLFASDDDDVSGNSAPHVYAVLEYESGLFRHFGFGSIDKIGDWVGGEFVGGHVWPSGAAASVPTTGFGSVLLDGAHGESVSPVIAGTVHVEGLPGMAGASKWGVAWNRTSFTPATGNDRAGNARADLYGGIRASMYTDIFGPFVPSALTGFVPLLPCPVWYSGDPTGTNRRLVLLGSMPNARMVQMRNFNPGDEIAIGGNDWKIFPVVRKSNVGGTNPETRNMGLAYLKVPNV